MMRAIQSSSHLDSSSSNDVHLHADVGEVFMVLSSLMHCSCRSLSYLTSLATHTTLVINFVKLAWLLFQQLQFSTSWREIAKFYTSNCEVGVQVQGAPGVCG